MFWTNQALEDMTASCICKYERQTRIKVEPPIRLDSIAETVFDLTLLYQAIEEPPGLQILGGLAVAEKIIVINELHLPDFKVKPGRERFTLAHEIGHWDLYEQHKSTQQGDLFGGKRALDTRMVCRSAGGLELKVVAQAWSDERLHAALKHQQQKCDDPVEGRAVDRYAGMLLMPRSMLLPEYDNVVLDDWRDLGPLADLFGVSLTALSWRLRKMGKLHVTEDGRLLKCSEEEYRGQMSIS
jgi:hypothetical protein